MIPVKGDRQSGRTRTLFKWLVAVGAVIGVGVLMARGQGQTSAAHSASPATPPDALYYSPRMAAAAPQQPPPVALAPTTGKRARSRAPGTVAASQRSKAAKPAVWTPEAAARAAAKAMRAAKRKADAATARLRQTKPRAAAPKPRSAAPKKPRHK